MATTPTGQNTLNNIRNHSIHTLYTKIQPLLNQNKTILDEQYSLTKIPAKNIKYNTIEHVDTRSTNIQDMISHVTYRRHTTSIDTRKGGLNQLSNK